MPSPNVKLADTVLGCLSFEPLISRGLRAKQPNAVGLDQAKKKFITAALSGKYLFSVENLAILEGYTTFSVVIKKEKTFFRGVSILAYVSSQLSTTSLSVC